MQYCFRNRVPGRKNKIIIITDFNEKRYFLKNPSVDIMERLKQVIS